LVAIVEGGQTMNPVHAGDFGRLREFADIILPNNKNIILAANQAMEMTVKQVAVVCRARPSRKDWPPCSLTIRTVK
jgi:dihydroxyacetone kinase-like predicted kinase